MSLSGAYLSLCYNAVRFSEGARPAGRLPAAMLRPYPRSNGSEGNGIGNARGIPPCGARRRHLFGCQGVGPAFRGRTARSSVAISATSLARVQSAPCPFGLEWTTCWTRLKLALGWSIAHGFGAIDMDGQDGQDTRGVLGLTGMGLMF